MLLSSFLFFLLANGYSRVSITQQAKEYISTHSSWWGGLDVKAVSMSFYNSAMFHHKHKLFSKVADRITSSKLAQIGNQLFLNYKTHPYYRDVHEKVSEFYKTKHGTLLVQKIAIAMLNKYKGEIAEDWALQLIYNNWVRPNYIPKTLRKKYIPIFGHVGEDIVTLGYYYNGLYYKISYDDLGRPSLETVSERGLKYSWSPLDFVGGSGIITNGTKLLSRTLVKEFAKFATVKVTSKVLKGALVSSSLTGAMNLGFQLALDPEHDIDNVDWGSVGFDVVTGALLGGFYYKIFETYKFSFTGFRQLMRLESLKIIGRQQCFLLPMSIFLNVIRADMIGESWSTGAKIGLMSRILSVPRSATYQGILRGKVGDRIWGKAVEYANKAYSAQGIAISKFLDVISTFGPRFLFEGEGNDDSERLGERESEPRSSYNENRYNKNFHTPSDIPNVY